MGETIMFQVATLTVRTRQKLSRDVALYAVERISSGPAGLGVKMVRIRGD